MFLEKIGAQRMVQNSPAVDRLAGALDRLSPGLGQAARQQAGANLSAGINMLGEQTTLEGRRAVTLPLRFTDGAAFLGPIPIGEYASVVLTGDARRFFLPIASKLKSNARVVCPAGANPCPPPCPIPVC